MDKEFIKYIDDEAVDMAITFFTSDISADPNDIKLFADDYKDVLVLKNKWSDDLQVRYDTLMSLCD